jgi:hypothetical protein
VTGFSSVALRERDVVRLGEVLAGVPLRDAERAEDGLVEALGRVAPGRANRDVVVDPPTIAETFRLHAARFLRARRSNNLGQDKGGSAR